MKSNDKPPKRRPPSLIRTCIKRPDIAKVELQFGVQVVKDILLGNDLHKYSEILISQVAVAFNRLGFNLTAQDFINPTNNSIVRMRNAKFKTTIKNRRFF